MVEAAYRLDGNEQDWLTGIASAAAPLSTDGRTFAVSYEPTPAPFHHRKVCVADGVDPSIIDTLLDLEGLAKLDPVAAPRLHRTTICETSSEGMVRMGVPPEVLDLSFGRGFHQLGVRDCIAVQGVDLRGNALCIMATLTEPQGLSPKTRNLWQRVAVHLSAALRLRAALSDAAPAAVLESAGAVFDGASGRCVHADNVPPSLRERLRDWASALERARADRHASPGQVLQLWQGLLEGSYSIADVFDTDGRRFLVAIANEPVVAEDRRLTRRERQALALAASGHDDVRSAYALGISPSTLRTHLRRALRKSGLKDRAVLMELLVQLEGLRDA